MDIRKVVTELVDIMKMQAEKQNTTILLQFDELIPSSISLDKDRFQQVLLNLLTNAIKFTHDGDIDIELRLKPSDKGKQLNVAVHDSGIGIP